MGFDDVVRFIQTHFSDGLVFVIGSGLSAAEGIPGMGALADHLKTMSVGVGGDDLAQWLKIQPVMDSEGLEAALLRYPPSPTLESWIIAQTCDLLVPKERQVIGAVVNGKQTLRLTLLLKKIIKPAAGLPIVTPNYDRLAELACEMAGMHVDTTAIGIYAGAFDNARSCMASCKGVFSRGRTTMLEHYPRAVILKPHGSFDWYRNGAGVYRCAVDIDGERHIITPGLNKYKAGYGAPFDKHRELANNHINQAARLVVVGYGFNDDHLQTHLMNRIRSGVPTLILTRSAAGHVQDLAATTPNCLCIARPAASSGVSVVTNGTRFEQSGPDLWDIGVLAKEILA